MKVCYIVSRIQVIGYIWMPNTLASMSYRLSDSDIENIKKIGDGIITRRAIEKWLTYNIGDFNQIVDFAVTIGDNEFDSDWEKEDSDYLFDCSLEEELATF